MALLFVLSCAGAASAQESLSPFSRAKTLWNPIVGSGALYQMEVEGDAASNGTMEVDVLTKERVNGKDAFWLQVVGKRTGKPEWVWRMLVGDDASHETFRSVFRLSGHSPIELPVPKKSAQDYHPENATDLGRETLAVPAGTFVCEHYRYRSKNSSIEETWLSKKVVPWGVVKEQSTHNGKPVRMTLLKVSTGVNDRFSVTPQLPNSNNSQVPGTRP